MSLGGLCWAALFPAVVLGQGDPASLPPQEEDVLVKLGDPASKPLTLGDVSGNAELVAAWPMAPASKVVRSGNRLNELLLVRLDPTLLDGASASNAVGGVLAYSGLCPHAGCNVTTWIPEKGVLSCDCHASDFDARTTGKVIAGPAAQPLPPLPLKLSGDVLVVAKSFAAPIRFDE